jgi:UDP-2,4-diacetamido-2,4,6-trideoxy-beta-L-altropyranose hydrolase
MVFREREKLRLRAARADDAELFFVWANDQEVRRQSLRTDEIPWHTHQQWFRSKLENAHSRMFVLEAESLPVGQVRFDFDGGEARIDYSIDVRFRGRGWGRCLISLGMGRMTEREPLVFRADVKMSNAPSAAVFVRLGFRESAAPDRSDLKVFRFDTALQTMAGLT